MFGCVLIRANVLFGFTSFFIQWMIIFIVWNEGVLLVPSCLTFLGKAYNCKFQMILLRHGDVKLDAGSI